VIPQQKCRPGADLGIDMLVTGGSRPGDTNADPAFGTALGKNDAPTPGFCVCRATSPFVDFVVG